MKRIVLCLLAVLVAGAGAAHADTAWGLRGGATFDPDQVHVGVHMIGGELFNDGWFIPNIEIGFGDNLTLIAINPELVYKFNERSSSNWGFYIGGGLGINIYNWDSNGNGDDSDTELGVNILGGMNKNLSSGNELFLELKIGVIDESPDAKVTIGLTFF